MMMTMTPADRLVADYLDSLRAALSDLPFGEANELVNDIATHIDESRAELRGADLDTDGEEAGVRAILERLGDPRDIAAEAGSGGRPAFAPAYAVPPEPAGPRPGALEYIGLAAMGLGPFLVPILAPLVGLIMVSASPCWTGRQKLTAWLITLLPIALLMAGAALAVLAGPSETVPSVPAPVPVPTG